MTLLSNETIWLFLLASPCEPETRHVGDVILGVHFLENIPSISHNNIKLFIDGDKDLIEKQLSQFTHNKYEINKPNDIKNIVANISCKNIVLFVTGHGSVDAGICGIEPIKPYNLLDNIRCNKNVENIVIYLGQCYAGIFNYINVMDNPKTIIIGATNLHQSISATINKIPWSTNLFLYNIYRWIANPIDIDGDGKITVMDSYKYAAAETNKLSYQYKSICLSEILKLLKEREKLTKKLNSAKTTDKNKNAILLQLKEVNAKLSEQQNIHYNNQESWILNSIPAQSIEF